MQVAAKTGKEPGCFSCFSGMAPKQKEVDVVLIGAGVMSATVALMIKELEPEWKMVMYERLGQPGEESSNGFNNAGTGHAGFMEPHHTKELQLPGSLQQCMRSWCQFRAGFITISGRGGRASSAKYQDCFFCSCMVRNYTVHCLSVCSAWNTYRGDYGTAAGISPAACSKDEFARAVLACVPGSAGFAIVARWLDEVDAAACDVMKKCPNILYIS